MGEGPYRTAPKSDEEFDPEKHVMVDEKSWVRKSAAQTYEAAEKEAGTRNLIQGNEKPSWFARLFGRRDRRETAQSVLQEEAIEKELKNINYIHFSKKHSIPFEFAGWIDVIEGEYNGHEILIKNNGDKYAGTIENEEITAWDAEKIWKRLFPLIEKRDQMRRRLEHTYGKGGSRHKVLEVLGHIAPQPKNLPETTEPKQLPEKTEE